MKELLLRRSGLLNTRQVADILGVSQRTIIRWRCNRVNLDYAMIGGQARYELAVVEAYKHSQTVRVKAALAVSA